MKSLIVIAIASHLVSVHSSRIIEQDLDYEDLHDTGRDYISVENSNALKSGRNKDVQKRMEEIVDGYLKRAEDDVVCTGAVCNICGLGLCLTLTHVLNNNKIDVLVSFHSDPLYKKQIIAKEWSRCQRIHAYGANITPCIKISKVTIKRGRICHTVTVEIPHRTKRTYERLCF